MQTLCKMTQTEDLCEFIKSLGPRVSTNSAIPLNRFIAMAMKGSHCLYLRFSEGVLMLFDQEHFFSLYYYLKNGFDISLRNIVQDFKGTGKPVILEAVRSKVRSTMTEDEKAQWLKYGFQEYAQVEKMCYTASGTALDPLPSGYSCVPASGKLLKRATACFYDVFDPLCDQLPLRDTFLSGASGQPVYALLSEIQEPVGYLHFTQGRKLSELLHFCVVPELQGKGYGKILLAGYRMLLESLQISRAVLWVHSSNFAAKRVYLQAGFSFDGKAADKYIYRNEIS